MKQMVMKVNQQSPDLIVVAGDIFDNEYDALDDPDQLVKIFRQLKSAIRCLCSLWQIRY